MSVFRTDKIPSLNRLPKELGRKQRQCEVCGETTEQILYLVPKKFAFVYLKDHSENVHATCIKCAHSTVLVGKERERVLSLAG